MPETDAEVATEQVPTESPAGPTSPAPAAAPPEPAETSEGESLEPETQTVPGTEAPPEPEPEDLDTAIEAGYYDPFQFRAEGRDWTYPGAVQDDDGNVLFTPAAVRQLQRDLAFARDYPRRTTESGRELARERTAREAAEKTLETVLGKFEKMFEESQGATTVEELLQTSLGKWILERHAEWPKLRADGLQQGFDRRQKQLQEENAALRRADQEREQRPMMVGMVEEAVRHWAPEAGLDERSQQRLIERFTTDEMLDLVFPRAQQDDPVRGVKAGERWDNRGGPQNSGGVILQEMLYLQGLLKKRGGAEALKAENERRQGKDATEAPPVAGGKRGTPNAEKGGKVKYKTTREADEAAGLI